LKNNDVIELHGKSITVEKFLQNLLESLESFLDVVKGEHK